MNKDDLINKIASNLDMKKTEARAAVDSVITNIVDSLKSGKEVRLVGFGTFLVSKREARTGRNPRTGETIQIPAKKTIRWKMSKILYKRLNNNFTESKISVKN